MVKTLKEIKKLEVSDFAQICGINKKVATVPVPKKIKFATIDWSAKKMVEPIEFTVNSLNQVEQLEDPLLQGYFYNGYPVLLYIRDQYVERTGNADYKYHICWCSALEKQKEEGKISKYVVSNEPSNMFKVNLYYKKPMVTEVKRLEVCKECLRKINYRRINKKTNYHVNEMLRKSFNPENFFALQNKRKRILEINKLQEFRERCYQQRSNMVASADKYDIRWSNLSRMLRMHANWTCSKCGKSCEDDHSSLTVHHIDSNKKNNARNNLVVLCKECHNEIHGIDD